MDKLSLISAGLFSSGGIFAVSLVKRENGGKLLLDHEKIKCPNFYYFCFSFCKFNCKDLILFF
jgi:hypothetical protein